MGLPIIRFNLLEFRNCLLKLGTTQFQIWFIFSYGIKQDIQKQLIGRKRKRRRDREQKHVYVTSNRKFGYLKKSALLHSFHCNIFATVIRGRCQIYFSISLRFAVSFSFSFWYWLLAWNCTVMSANEKGLETFDIKYFRRNNLQMICHFLSVSVLTYWPFCSQYFVHTVKYFVRCSLIQMDWQSNEYE